MYKVLIYLLLFTTFSCTKKNSYEVSPIKLNTGWGYIITMNNKIIIKQTHIPAIPENTNFQTKEDALKVGEFVLKRIKTRLSPSITKNDLILLGIKSDEASPNKVQSFK